MARRHHELMDENFVPIPRDAYTFEGFQRWVDSGDFPDTGRIDYLDGEIDVDMSPEDLFTHGAPKGAIHAALHFLIAGKRGEVFVDCTRVTSRSGALSIEPDVVVVLWETLQSGRVRYIPAAVREPDRFSRIDGPVDIVIEILSDGSQSKDLKRLPLLLAQAGVPEYWIADTRREKMLFEIRTLGPAGFTIVEPDADGWTRSPRLGVSFRLTRSRTPFGTWHYELEHREG